MMAVGVIDIGATYTRAFFGDSDAEPNAKTIQQWPTSRSYHQTIDRINEYREASSTLDKVAISIGASVDPSGKIAASGKFPDFVGRSFRKGLGLAAKAECHVAHDCVCALLELQARTDSTDAFGYITFSTGLGGAFAKRVGNQLVVSRVRIAHQSMDLDGPPCSCGRKGCAAVYLDSDRVKERLEKDLSEIDDEAFWQEYTDTAIRVIINFATMMNLGKLYLGGGVLDSRKEVTTRIFQSTKSIGLGRGYGSCEVEVIPNSAYLPLLGAYRLAQGLKPLIIG